MNELVLQLEETWWPMCPGLLETFPVAKKVSHSVEPLSLRQTWTLVTLREITYPVFLLLFLQVINANTNIPTDWALQYAKCCVRCFIYPTSHSLHNDPILQMKKLRITEVDMWLVGGRQCMNTVCQTQIIF